MKSLFSEQTKLKRLNMSAPNEVLKEAVNLKPAEKAELIDKLLSNLDEPDKEIDELWASEVEDRIESYEKDDLRSVSLDKILAKYR
jgi:hypothetical protein